MPPRAPPVRTGGLFAARVAHDLSQGEDALEAVGADIADAAAELVARQRTHGCSLDQAAALRADLDFGRVLTHGHLPLRRSRFS